VRTHYFKLPLALLGFLGAAAMPVHAANFLVGSGASCQFNTIQAAVNAAAANPGADTVRIANAGTYFAEAVTIGAQDLTIDGDFAACADATPSGTDASISGQGGAAAPVFTITGAGIRRFQNVSIVRGDQTNLGAGGGINYNGTGELVLNQVGLSNNTAGFGGAINFVNSGGPATLTLLEDVSILFNTASAGGGGGIRLAGSARLVVQSPRVVITLNTATADGGGLAILDNAVAVIASEGFGSGVITDNTAANGGGVAVIADSADERPVLLMYSTQAASPVSLRNNIASSKGGAIYARPVRPFLGGTEGIPRICLLSFYLSGNRAQEGAAIYGDTDNTLDDYQGAETYLNVGTCGETIANAIDCARNQNGCNTVENQVSQTSAGLATSGATILMQDAGTLLMRDVTFFNNRGGSLIRTIEETNFALRNALVVGNNMTGPLIRINSEADDLGFILQHTTIASNTIGGAQVVQFEDGPSSLKFNHNLIFQPGKISVTLPFAIANNAGSNWDHNATSDPVQVLPLPSQLVNIDPRFNSAALGDFRLRVGSSLVDRFPNIPSNNVVTRDLDGRVRPVNLAIVDNQTVDVGAFERQESDPWLLNGNFDNNTNYWPSDNPGLTSYSTVNAAGSTGGSIQFSRGAVVGANTPRFNAAVQCFNVPGPGVYRLTGAGRGSISQFSPASFPRAYWRVRSNSSTCAQAAPVAFEGDLALPSGNVLTQVATPAEITITQALWTPNTTIEVRLDVNVGILDAPIFAAFDNIQITGTTSEIVFANGFE
jgi:predicted outer membrane repeat protein